MPVASPGAATRTRPRNERTRLNAAMPRFGLLDPHGALTGTSRPALLLVDSRDVAAVCELAPGIPVVGVGGAISRADADRIVSAGTKHTTLYLWTRSGGQHVLTRRLLAAKGEDDAVLDVLVVPHEGDHEQPAALLARLGPQRAGRRVDALLREAEWAGRFDPANGYDARNKVAA